MELLEYIKIIIIGIIEGITEWLPISSTGHMILFQELFPLKMSEEFVEMFDVVIQLGAIMAVVVLYFFKLLPLCIPGKDGVEKGTKVTLCMPKIIMWLKILVSCLPAIIIGLPFDDLIDSIFYNGFTVSITLIIYGIAFIVIEKKHKNKTDFRCDDIGAITYKDALIIGAFQVLALIPGTSRSGATIIGAMLIGISRVTAAEYTFFLAIPVMFGASLLKILKFGLAFSTAEITALVLGMIVAFVVSVIAIKFLMGYIKKHDFSVFGWYRIVLGIIVLAFFILK